jgi:hypothetical protein
LDAEAAQLAANSLRKLGSCPSFVWIYGDFLAMKQDSERDMQDDTDGFLWLTMASWSMSRFFFTLAWHGGMAWGTRAEHHLLPIGRLQSSTGHALHLLAQWPYRGVGLREKNMDKYMDNTWQRYSKIMKNMYIYKCVYIYIIYI